MPSLRKAIDDHCKACIYDPYAEGLGKWREQVAACTSPECPLYPVRPRPNSRTKAAKSIAFEGENG